MFRPSRILFPTDFSYYSFFAMKYATALTRRYNARLHIAHAVNSNVLLPWGSPSFWLWSESVRDMETCMCQRASCRLQHLLEGMAKEGLDADYRVVRGTPAPEICRLTRELECDLVVVGTHGRTGFEHALFGSVAEEVARCAPIPVLTIKHPEHEFLDSPGSDLHPDRIMFATDFSPYSLSVLPFAASVCREFNATLVLFHAVERPAYGGEFLPDAAVTVTEDLEARGYEQLREIAEDCKGITVEVIQTCGVPSYEIARVADAVKADLLVLPTHGRTGVRRIFLGGVARKALRHVRCPVLTVRPEMAAVKITVTEDAFAAPTPSPEGEINPAAV